MSWFKRNKVVTVPGWSDVSVTVGLGRKVLGVFEVVRKLFWNVVNIVCNTRAILRTVKQALVEVCHG